MSRKIIRRLVDELKDREDDKFIGENITLEQLERRELAKTRVVLRSSFKIHSLIFILGNVFIFLINIIIDFNHSSGDNIFDLWAMWVVLAWGLALLAHGTVILTIEFLNLERRIFTITSILLFYVVLFLIYGNVYANQLVGEKTLWWPWAGGAILIFIVGHAYIVFENENIEKMELKIEREITKIIKSENDKKKKIRSSGNKNQ